MVQSNKTCRDCGIPIEFAVNKNTQKWVPISKAVYDETDVTSPDFNPEFIRHKCKTQPSQGQMTGTVQSQAGRSGYRQQPRQIKSCYNCGQDIYFDDNIRSTKSNKCIPLDPKTEEPHQCPNRPQYTNRSPNNNNAGQNYNNAPRAQAQSGGGGLSSYQNDHGNEEVY